MPHRSAAAPIGVFDSGIGGLSVLQHIRQSLPGEALLYVADSGYAPYGDKSEALISARSLAIVGFLLDQGCKAIVVACNTATAAAIKAIRTAHPHLIVVGVEPALKPAAMQSANKKIGVLATYSTTQSEKFQTLRDQIAREHEVQFFTQACVGLVDQIERGEPDAPATRELLERYLHPLVQAGVDTLVLGCTHYPFVAAQIRAVAEQPGTPAPHLIDTGAAVTRQLQRLLHTHALHNPAPPPAPPLRAYTSGDCATLTRALRQLLGLGDGEFSVGNLGLEHG